MIRSLLVNVGGDDVLENIALTDSFSVGADVGGSHTINGCLFGEPSADRVLILCVVYLGTRAPTATIGGVTASLCEVSTVSAAVSPGTAIFSAAVPSGTSGEVVVIPAGGAASPYCTGALYRVTGLASHLPRGTSNQGTNTASASTAQVSRVSLMGTPAAGDTYYVWVNGIEKSYVGAGGVSAVTVMNALVSRINADAALNPLVRATRSGTDVVISALTAGTPFTLAAIAIASAATLTPLFPTESAPSTAGSAIPGAVYCPANGITLSCAHDNQGGSVTNPRLSCAVKKPKALGVVEFSTTSTVGDVQWKGVTELDELSNSVGASVDTFRRTAAASFY